MARFNYNFINSDQNNTVKSLINEYKTNIDKIFNYIETVVEGNTETTNYLKSINNEYKKRYELILDEIYEDQEFRNINQDELKKILKFYNRLNLDELETIKHRKVFENLISVVHSNNDKLISKVLTLKSKFDN